MIGKGGVFVKKENAPVVGSRDYSLIGFHPCFIAEATLSKLFRAFSDRKMRMDPLDILSLSLPIFISPFRLF